MIPLTIAIYLVVTLIVFGVNFEEYHHSIFYMRRKPAQQALAAPLWPLTGLFLLVRGLFRLIWVATGYVPK